jgi:hypothetical protein
MDLSRRLQPTIGMIDSYNLQLMPDLLQGIRCYTRYRSVSAAHRLLARQSSSPEFFRGTQSNPIIENSSISLLL